MRTLVGFFLLLMFCATLVACASPPRTPRPPLKPTVAFFSDTETPFPRRAQRHLGLSVEVDPVTLDEQRFTRLGPASGNVFYYATVTLYKADPRFPLGKMNMAFDTSVVCIKRDDLAALGFIAPGMPIVNHGIRDGALVVTGLIPTPDRIDFSTPRGHIDISLSSMADQGCVARIEHDIQLAPAG